MAEIFHCLTIEEKTCSFELQTIIRDEITGRVDIVWRIFEKTAIKLKLK